MQHQSVLLQKWQRRFFLLYEHGLLRYALDDLVSVYCGSLSVVCSYCVLVAMFCLQYVGGSVWTDLQGVYVAACLLYVVCFICIWYNMAGFMVCNRDSEHDVPNGILLHLVHNFRIYCSWQYFFHLIFWRICQVQYKFSLSLFFFWVTADVNGADF